MALQRIVVETPLTAAQDAANMRLNGLGSWRNVFALFSWLRGFAKGTRNGNIKIKQNAIRSTATITSTGTASNNETMVLANVTLTAKTSGAVAASGEFNISGTVATQATNIAAAINAVPTLTGIVTATSSLGVVTVTASVPGLLGQGLQISEALSNVTATAFAGGTDGTAYNLTLGQVIA